MSKILVLQHHPAEGLGPIADALAEAALAWQLVRGYAGQDVPKEMAGAGGLVVMGGPMGVYETERYPFLRDELRLIENALKAGKPILSVCLGSQLLAAALGAKVTKGISREIGWFPVRLSPAANDDRLMCGLPESFTAFHWHGDVFELPHGAVALASSEKTPLQAFRYGEAAYGILFHFEATKEWVRSMVRVFADEVREANADPAAILAGIDQYLDTLSAFGNSVFGRWAIPLQGDAIG